MCLHYLKFSDQLPETLFFIWPFNKTFFMLNSTEQEIYHAHKCWNANNGWHFNIYKHDKNNI